MAKFHLMCDNAKETKYAFHCPGCGGGHWVRTRGDHPKWTVSGLENDKPTVHPSILAHGCHSFIIDGKIQFLGDCTHKLAGQTVEIPDFDE